MGFYQILSILLLLDKVISFIVVLFIIRNSRSLNRDILWIVLVLLLPFIGTLMYVLFGSDLFKSKLLKDILDSTLNSKDYLIHDKEISLNREDMAMRYLSEHCGFPITRRNNIVYYPSGEVFFENVKKELLKAQKFIFIEFFSIESGALWDDILAVLKDKVKRGIEVRIIYDSVACFNKISSKYYKELESFGIMCEPYYKKSILWSAINNHREHRKCIIIDGKIAFTGGMNIEDRYVNLEEVYGYWKDVGIFVRGDAVLNFTVMFLSMWNVLRNNDEDYFRYRLDNFKEVDKSGYTVAFDDNPLDKENVAKNTYINLISQANDSICIFTPYLILDLDIYNVLALAAKRGVDVKIVIPGIPDKKSVYKVSLMNARKLLNEGVKVYTYTPGFMHGKVIVVDDKVAMVGTMNIDFRSFYSDFECGLLVDDKDVVCGIKKDVDEVLEQSSELVSSKSNFFDILCEGLLQLFSSLM